MKKVLAALTIVAILAIAPSAMAKNYKAPKLMCLEWSGWYQQLSFKSIGKVYIDGKKVKTYAINGMDTLDRAITGTGYVVPGTPILIASFDTQYIYNGNTTLATGSYDLEFDLETESGTVYYRYSGGLEQNGNVGVVSGDCKELSILSALEATNLNSLETGMNTDF